LGIASDKRPNLLLQFLLHLGMESLDIARVIWYNGLIISDLEKGFQMADRDIEDTRTPESFYTRILPRGVSIRIEEREDENGDMVEVEVEDFEEFEYD
jgi:hypothetical protein